MKRKRGKFMTFILSCIPGAGQMYLGFFKEGVSLMLLFIGVLVLSSWLYVDVLGLLAIVVWFYAFFDAINKNSMPDEEFVALEDHYVLLENVQELPKLSVGKGKKFAAVFLILFGIYLLGNDVVAIMAQCGIYLSYELSRILTRYIPQMLISFLIIGLGIKMILGKKSDLQDDDDKYLEGREDE